MLSEGLCEEVVPGSQERGRAARLHYLAVAVGRGRLRHGCACLRGCGARVEGRATRPARDLPPPLPLRGTCGTLAGRCRAATSPSATEESISQRSTEYIIIQGKV